MGQIVQIEVRPDMLVEMLSRAVLHCRREMNELMDDVEAVPQDIDEYRRLFRVMDMALDVLEAVDDFDSTQLVGVTLERREEQEDGVDR